MTRRGWAKVDTDCMRVRSGRSNRLRAILLLPGLLAITPTIQVCHLSPADRDAFFRCLLFGPSSVTAAATETCKASAPACEAGSCPLMADCGTSCPLAQRRPATYCIGDPAGPGLRSSAPETPTLDRIDVALISAVVIEPPARPAPSTLLELQPRPPTRAPDAPAPIRGPPSVA